MKFEIGTKIYNNKNIIEKEIRIDMKPLLDLHTHTVASGHAYSSLQEMVQAAADKNLHILGITEHGPSIPGTCPLLYFRNMGVIPRKINGVKLMMGCEINILDTDGNLDIDETMMELLEIRIAGIHSICWKGGSRDENTQGLIKVIENPYIQIICHPGDGTADLNFEPIVIAAKNSHTLLEINNHSLAPFRKRKMAHGNNLEILRLCKKYEVPVILGSDAHISYQVADYERLYPLLAETEFPDELIMNYWPERCMQYIGIEKQIPTGGVNRTKEKTA